MDLRKIELGEIFQSLEKFSLDKEEIFSDQSLKKIRFDWNKIVGDLLGDSSFPHELKEGKLIVICKHSLVAQELDFTRNQTLEKIIKLNLPVSVKKIIFRAGNSPNLKK